MTRKDAWSIELKKHIDEINQKPLFTPGPASLCEENISALKPAFGRGDDCYASVESKTLSRLLSMSGHEHIVRLQGSASLALEIAARNFVYGKVLIVETGYYSERLAMMVQSVPEVNSIDTVSHSKMDSITGHYDWVVSCYVETSCGTKVPIEALRVLADRLNSRLYVDATASIGLEEGHYHADIIGFSSCKGLCGLTGAAFIAYNGSPNNEVSSFYLNLETHRNRKVTGPYHIIQSLSEVLSKNAEIKYAVNENKRLFLNRFKQYCPVPSYSQPMICTHVNKRIFSKIPALLYEPRVDLIGSVVCHLGEVHLGRHARGEIVEHLFV